MSSGDGDASSGNRIRGEEADADGARELKEMPVQDARRANLHILCTINGLFMMALMMLLDAKLVVYMRHFKGDIAKTSKLIALAVSTNQLSTIVTAPLISSLSDMYGRKALLLSTSLYMLVLRLFDLSRLTPNTLHITTALAAPGLGIGQVLAMSVGDIFHGDPKSAGGAMATLQAAALVSQVVGPQIGAALAAKDIRLPFAFGSALLAASVSLVYFKAPETRPESFDARRTECRWPKVNPLNFLVLFKHGPKLAMLASCEVLQMLVDPRLLGHTHSLMLTATLGWGQVERARYTSAKALVGVPGFALAGKVSKRLGSQMALLVGSAASVVEFILESRVTKPWQEFALILAGLPQGTKLAGRQTLLLEAAAHAGIGQGELQGMLSSMGQITSGVGLNLWARIFGICTRNGRPRRFYLVAAAVAAFQLIISNIACGLSSQGIREGKKATERRLTWGLTPQA